MSGEPLYEPNSFTAVLTRLDTKVDTVVASLVDLKTEFKEAHQRLHKRLDTHEEDLRALKSSEAVRKKEMKWAVALIALIGWGINAALAWMRGA